MRLPKERVERENIKGCGRYESSAFTSRKNTEKM